MIYENMISGAFIYSLGVIAGRRTEVEVMDSINFIQQTPYDKPIGDLLANWGGRTFIVEFKKGIDEIKSEFNKEHKKKMLNELVCNSELLELSQSIHFMAFGVHKSTNIEIHFQYYTSSIKGSGISNSNFIDKLLEPNSKIGVSNKEGILKYLNFLMKFSKYSDVDALIVNVSSDGRPIFFKVDNYLKLNLSLNQKLEKTLNQAQSIDRTPSKGRGMSM
jgi:hypothetical protein